MFIIRAYQNIIVDHRISHNKRWTTFERGQYMYKLIQAKHLTVGIQQ